jgi:hypothetical protein
VLNLIETNFYLEIACPFVLNILIEGKVIMLPKHVENKKDKKQSENWRSSI